VTALRAFLFTGLLTALPALAAAQPVVAARPEFPTPAFADPHRATRLAAAFPEVERIFREHAERAHVPGYAFGILVDGRLVFAGAGGLADLETKAPVTTETVFRIASMTKSFTALAILRLRDEGRLSLDDPAAKFIPEMAALVYPTADTAPITVRHLLTHAGGFPEDNPWGDRQLAVSDAQLDAWLRAGLPFSTAPGTAFEYSNYGFALLGRIVSRASGMPYRDYLAAHLLRPLGMPSTTLEAAAVPAARKAIGYRWDDPGEAPGAAASGTSRGQWVAEPILADGAFGPMGGLWTSLADLARYVGYLMSAWPPRDDADPGPVRRSSLREMQQVARLDRATIGRDTVDGPLRLNAGGYAYGLRVTQDCRAEQIVGHGGGLPGYGSLMRWLPQHGVGLIALGNRTYAGWGGTFDAAFDALARTGALQPRAVQPSAALVAARSELSALLASWDEDRFERLAADNLDRDLSRDRRRARFEELRAAHGACRDDGTWIEVENALRGQWRLACDRGFLTASITLAPTMPPRAQSVRVNGTLPPSAAFAAAAEAIAEATRTAAGPDSAGLPGVLANLTQPESARRQLRALATTWGTCTAGPAVGGNGTSRAVLRFTCARGDVLVAMDGDADGRVSELRIVPAPEARCGP
jgi:CubicO group peptidase (beta-lactamase class C family)